MKIVYFSVTGQTKRFVKKLNLPAFEIEPGNPYVEISEPFVLVVPTYEPAITDPVNDFLEEGENAKFLKGVAGSGNRNFAGDFIYTAKNLAKAYQVPLIFGFEFSGTEEDVKNFKKVVSELES